MTNSELEILVIAHDRRINDLLDERASRYQDLDKHYRDNLAAAAKQFSTELSEIRTAAYQFAARIEHQTDAINIEIGQLIPRLVTMETRAGYVSVSVILSTISLLTAIGLLALAVMHVGGH